MKLVIAVLATSFFLTGCLKTRNEVRENEKTHVMQQQVVTLQKTNADVTSRFSDLEEQMREINGRVDVVENRIGKNDSGVENALKSSSQQQQELNSKVNLLQEALTKMEADLHSLAAEVQALKTDRTAVQAEHSVKQSKKDAYDLGKDFFEKKDWKQAILNFQKYRDEHPKSKNFGDATYKIGVSFQELGMVEEARTFYDEIINKFPKTEEARKAKIRLKGLK